MYSTSDGTICVKRCHSHIEMGTNRNCIRILCLMDTPQIRPSWVRTDRYDRYVSYTSERTEEELLGFHSGRAALREARARLRIPRTHQMRRNGPDTCTTRVIQGARPQKTHRQVVARRNTPPIELKCKKLSLKYPQRSHPGLSYPPFPSLS